MLYAEKKWIALALTNVIDRQCHPITDKAIRTLEDPIHYQQKRKVQVVQGDVRTVPKRRTFLHGPPTGYQYSRQPVTVLSPAVLGAAHLCANRVRNAEFRPGRFTVLSNDFELPQPRLERDSSEQSKVPPSLREKTAYILSLWSRCTTPACFIGFIKK